MKNNFINTYVKYTTKKPILFFAMIFIGVISIIILSLSTKTSVVLTSDGVVNDRSIVVSGKMDSYTGFIYAYNDRNDQVYSVEIFETVHIGEQTVFLLKGDNEYITTMNQREIKVDIPMREMTIFERVFLKGGKING